MLILNLISPVQDGAWNERVEILLCIFTHMSNNSTIHRTRSIPMPGFDRTGPIGRGPMTGRGFGYCRTAYQPAQPQTTSSGENQTGVTSENVPVFQPPVQGQAPVYGAGRGGIPYGGGRGCAFGGRGGRRGRCFW